MQSRRLGSVWLEAVPLCGVHEVREVWTRMPQARPGWREGSYSEAEQCEVWFVKEQEDLWDMLPWMHRVHALV